MDQQFAEREFQAIVPNSDQPVEVVVDQLTLDPSSMAIDIDEQVWVRLAGDVVDNAPSNDGADNDGDNEEALAAALALATWTIDDRSVASVSGSGLRRSVRGLSEGETMLTVQLGDEMAMARVMVGAEVTDPDSQTGNGSTTAPAPASSTTTPSTQPELEMLALNVSVNNDQTFVVTFATNLCTIARYEGAGQTFTTPGWPEVGAQCWDDDHRQTFQAVEPGSYAITVAARSSDNQLVSRSIVVEIDGPSTTSTDPEPPVTESTEPEPPVTESTDPEPSVTGSSVPESTVPETTDPVTVPESSTTATPPTTSPTTTEADSP